MMQYRPIWSFDDYVSAHIALGRLKEDGIDCWLKDEYTVTVDPILTNAVGGIKLMVANTQADDALAILATLQAKHRSTRTCPACGSHNIDLVSSPRKPSNWLFALFGFTFGNYALAAEKVYHCFDCNKEFESLDEDGGNDDDSAKPS
jgi:DNA-directed RNA polymerase subunit RPC12/RpoP